MSKGVKEGFIRIVPCSRQTLLKKVGHEINRFLSSGMDPSQIAVISVRGRAVKDSITHYEKLGGQRVVPASADEAGANIVCDTFLRFKGLERPAIIVTDLRLVSTNYEKRMYIAVSRALNVLSVVGSKETIEQDKRLGELLA